MASVGREPDGKANPIPEAITDPKMETNMAQVGCAITGTAQASNTGIKGTITDPKPTGKG